MTAASLSEPAMEGWGNTGQQRARELLHPPSSPLTFRSSLTDTSNSRALGLRQRAGPGSKECGPPLLLANRHTPSSGEAAVSCLPVLRVTSALLPRQESRLHISLPGAVDVLAYSMFSMHGVEAEHRDRGQGKMPATHLRDPHPLGAESLQGRTFQGDRSSLVDLAGPSHCCALKGLSSRREHGAERGCMP